MTEPQLSQYDTSDGSTEPLDLWRNEVQDRLAHYKRRRGRRVEGAYTMRFPFPAYEHEETLALPPAEVAVMVEPEQVIAEPQLRVELDEATGEFTQLAPDAGALDTAEPAEATVEPAEATGPELEAATTPVDFVLASPPAFEEEDVPFVDPIIRPRPKRKVIAFPRHLSVAPETTYRLADPVTTEVPRILDVPEELEAIPTTPYLDGLQLDVPDPAQEAARRDHVELPCRPVAVSKRVLAGAVDLAVVAVSAAVFGTVAYKIVDTPPPAKYLVLGLLASAVVLWVAYQYLFVVYGGKTLGMMAARIRLRTFKGKAPSVSRRRHRVLGLYMSSMSLGMGLMWSFVDVDGLCWHDRLSRTYLSQPE